MHSTRLVRACLTTSKHFSVAYFNSLDEAGKKGLIKICRSGIENPDSGMGCYAMQPKDYDFYKPFFSLVSAPLRERHVFAFCVLLARPPLFAKGDAGRQAFAMILPCSRMHPRVHTCAPSITARVHKSSYSSSAVFSHTFS